MRDLGRFMMGPNFWKYVMTTKLPWRERLASVNHVIYQNAMDRTRKDQWFWIEKYRELCRVPGFEPPKPPKEPEPPASPATAPATISLEVPDEKKA